MAAPSQHRDGTLFRNRVDKVRLQARIAYDRSRITKARRLSLHRLRSPRAISRLMKKPLVTASQIGKGQNRYSMNAAVICENESLRSETLKVAGDNQRGATDQAMQVVQDDLPEADPRLDYRVVITEVERLEDENTKDEAAG